MKPILKSILLFYWIFILGESGMKCGGRYYDYFHFTDEETEAQSS